MNIVPMTIENVGAIGVGVIIVLLAIVLWVFWPTPGPSPAEDALRQQNEALIKQNELLAADAAARTAEAQKLREDANAKLEEITPIRTQRRAARRDGAARRDAILATPDDLATDALRAQHARTRDRLRAVGAEPEPASVDRRTPQPR